MVTTKQLVSRLLFVIGFICALTPGAWAQTANKSADFGQVQKLAVAPFISIDSKALQSQELSATLDCALSGLCYREQNTLTAAEANLIRQLRQELAEYYPEALIPQPDVTQHFLNMPKGAKETPREIAIRLGQELGVDHVIIGILWRYKQRVGSALSAKSPASVAFNLFLLNVANKKLVWQGAFDKTQEALSDNLFEAALFFKSGVKWLSAEELAQVGIKKSLQGLK